MYALIRAPINLLVGLFNSSLYFKIDSFRRYVFKLLTPSFHSHAYVKFKLAMNCVSDDFKKVEVKCSLPLHN